MKAADSVRVPAVSTVPAAGEYANVPGTLAAAFSCAAPSGVPYAIDAGVGHAIEGVALATTIDALAVAAEYDRASAGVKVVVSVWPAPAGRMVPAGGV